MITFTSGVQNRIKLFGLLSTTHDNKTYSAKLFWGGKLEYAINGKRANAYDLCKCIAAVNLQLAIHKLRPDIDNYLQTMDNNLYSIVVNKLEEINNDSL